MNNHTSISTFLLMGFSDVRELQISHFFIFLALYLLSVTGNLFILIAVALDYHLHTPMYFLLSNLAVLDLGSVSVTVPKSMAMSLADDTSISYYGCVAQVFFFIFFFATGFCVLILMAHDRNIAICKPLQYERIMHKRACLQIVGLGWVAGLCYALLHTGGTFANTFCSNTVQQFFCEIPQLLKLACSDLYLVEVGLLVLSCSTAIGCLIFIIKTYVQIFATVLRIPSVHGQRKAFSTCIPHLTVVSVLILCGSSAYAKPRSDTSSDLDVAFAVIYSIIPPLLNPFIYSMRNKDLKNALWKLVNFRHSSKTISSYL
nr:olfactory receptor 14C36-like [Pogona vitticeps]XP_020663063.1 olfactory receptor 14C36-like [Pogona vitticeps]